MLLISFGDEFIILSTFPCPITEYAVFPIPVSKNRVPISFSLLLLSFIKYSFSPEIWILLVIFTISLSKSKYLSVLSIINETSAFVAGFFSFPPEKITSWLSLALMFLYDCSPKTHRTASKIFDFPLPFGPTIDVIPRLKSMYTLSPKDLKPFISTAFRYIFSPKSSIINTILYHINKKITLLLFLSVNKIL